MKTMDDENQCFSHFRSMHADDAYMPLGEKMHSTINRNVLSLKLHADVQNIIFIYVYSSQRTEKIIGEHESIIKNMT